MSSIKQQVFKKNNVVTNYDDADTDFSHVYNEMNILSYKQEAIENALDVVRNTRTQIQYAQEHDEGNNQLHLNALELALEGALGDSSFVPDKIDDQSLESLESKLELSLENILEEISRRITDFMSKFNETIIKLENKHEELKQRISNIENIDNDKRFTLTIGSIDFLTYNGAITPSNLPEQLSDTKEKLEEFTEIFFDFSKELYDHVAGYQNIFLELEGKDKDAANEAIEGSKEDFERIIYKHRKNIRGLSRHNLLGNYQIQVAQIANWKVKFADDTKGRDIPFPSLDINEDLEEAEDEPIQAPDKKTLEAILEESGSILEQAKKSQSYIEEINRSMKDASKNADTPKIRRNLDALKRIIPAGILGLLLGGGIGVGVAITAEVVTVIHLALYFGNGFKRMSRHTTDVLRDTLRYQIGLVKSAQELVDKSLKNNE